MLQHKQKQDQASRKQNKVFCKHELKLNVLF